VLLEALPPTANNQQLALASYEALPVGRVQTAGERRGAIGDQRSPIVRLRSSASRRRFDGRIRARRARSSFRATHSTPGVSTAAAARGCSERDTEIIVLSSFSLVSKPKERPSLSSRPPAPCGFSQSQGID